MEAERIRPDRPASIARWLLRRADDVAVALMGLMFVSFLLQIAFRYVLNQPLGWTEEVTVLCWLWVVLWCAAFVLADRDEIRFDIVYTPGTSHTIEVNVDCGGRRVASRTTPIRKRAA